jgi:hypothetical protein
MPNDVVFGGMFPEVEVEIAPLAEDLQLKLQAWFSERELAEVPAPNIVYAGETYYVNVRWWWTGDSHLPRHFCGKWKVKIDLESIGTAKEYTSAVKEIEMEPCEKGVWPRPYFHSFALTPGDVEPHEAGTVYLVSVTLATVDACGDPGHIWGYAKGPSVMFVPGSPHED